MFTFVEFFLEPEVPIFLFSIQYSYSPKFKINIFTSVKFSTKQVFEFVVSTLVREPLHQVVATAVQHAAK